MQGLESLNQFQKFVSSLGGLGRYGDTYMIHAEEGETVVPMEVLDRNPILKKRLFKSMKALGIDPGRYIVGNDLNSLNPVTGQPEFFFKQIGRRLRKAAADVSGYVAPIVGAMYGPVAGAAAGAMLGQYKRENPGDPSQWAQMALRGGMSGIASNIAGGQNMFTGTGLQHGTGTWNPLKIGQHYLTPDTGETPWKDYWNPKGFDMFDKTSGTGEGTEEIAKRMAKESFEKTGKDVFWGDFVDQADKITKAKSAIKGGMDAMEAIKLFGITTLGGGFLLDWLQGEPQDVGTRLPKYVEHGKDYGWGSPHIDYDYNIPIVPGQAEGGIMDLQGGGHARGPGTGTSDSIPAMLSDGEFVMTADAVRGAGGGNRREGAKRMYEAMDRLEARA